MNSSNNIPKLYKALNQTFFYKKVPRTPSEYFCTECI